MRDVRPYFVPPLDSIDASDWQRLVDVEWEPLEAWVEEWDYRTHLRLRSSVGVRLTALRSTTGLMDGTPLFWALGWRATESRLVSDPVLSEVLDGDNALQLEVPPDRAGATILLTRRLVLGRNRVHARSGEPRWAGSVLWSDETMVRLTGHGSAFPTEIVDFRTIGRDPRASWYLELPSSPDVAAMGSFLLLINSADTVLVAAVSAGRRTSEAHRVLNDTMFEGVVEEIVRWAIARWSELSDCEADSAGASARILTGRILPDAARWTAPDVDSMALKAAVIAGARSIGFGRRLS
ncbi:hypothetical protein ACQPZQ_34205 [Pseudonocardia sp. CA-142604]|uniref:hypothetical protein n=1 Tax=Pseudonocardia sp. CA-142604 TaxID=3240024 RepID=UPI003D9475D2